MAKREQSELDRIAKVIAESLLPLTILEIKARTGISSTARTLQRRLDKLLKQGIVERKGRTKDAVYAKAETTALFTSSTTEPDEVPLTTKSKEILALISKPLADRVTVGYARNFLDSYQPNITSYLTYEDRQRLAELGRTARENEPAGTYAKGILQRLLIDLSWNSSRLEGNTYSLLDTKLLLDNGKAADDKSAQETQMILNHKEAIAFIVNNTEDIGFNRYTLLNLHGILSDNLLPDPSASGRLRTFGVGIQQSVFVPLGIPQVIEEMFGIMLDKVGQIEDPFEQAFFIMVHLPYLQPFDDVNKRVSRIAANISLNAKNLVPISFVEVPQSLYIKGLLGVYEMNDIALLKDVFLWAYERSSGRYSALRQTIGEPDPFRLKYREQMRTLINEIVVSGLVPGEAMKRIDKTLLTITAPDRGRLKEAVESELISLHSGNIARYYIRPSQFDSWKRAWEEKA